MESSGTAASAGILPRLRPGGHEVGTHETRPAPLCSAVPHHHYLLMVVKEETQMGVGSLNHVTGGRGEIFTHHVSLAFFLWVVVHIQDTAPTGGEEGK